MVSCFEEFTGYNWERTAGYAGKVASVMCIFFGIMNWVFGFNAGIGFYTFFVGLLMTIWEMSFLYQCIGPCTKIYQFLQETLKFKRPIVLTILYSLLSIVTFIRKTPSIGGGIFLLFAALLNIFAQINQTSDENDNANNRNTVSNQA